MGLLEVGSGFSIGEFISRWPCLIGILLQTVSALVDLPNGWLFGLNHVLMIVCVGWIFLYKSQHQLATGISVYGIITMLTFLFLHIDY